MKAGKRATILNYLNLICYLLQDAKNGAEIKAVDAYCWLHSTVHLDTSLMRKLNTLPKIRDGLISMRTVAAMPNYRMQEASHLL